MQLNKTQRKARMKELIDGYPIGVPFSAEHLREVSELTGVALSHVEHCFNDHHPSDPRHLRVRYPGKAANDDLEPFSWNNAISPKKAETLAKEAMRKSVADQVDEVRQCVEPVCEECGKAMDSKDVCVDHIYPFNVLAEQFFDRIGGLPELKDGPAGAGRVLANPSEEDAWAVFHAENACYQVLCRSCNASKGVGL
jgi:hypothetical protein